MPKLSEEERKQKALDEAYMREQIEEVNRLRAIARETMYPILQAKFTPKEASHFCEWFNVLVQQALMKMAQDMRLGDLELTKGLPEGDDRDKIQAMIGVLGNETVGSSLKITGAFVEGIKAEKDKKTDDWTWEQVGLDLSDAETPTK